MFNRQICVITVFCIYILATSIAYSEFDDLQLSLYKNNPDAISQLQQGTLKWASVAWWGFNPEDSTDFLQSAIDSAANEVIVPNIGLPWIVRPIKLHSNQKITLMPGVVILAKKGEFKGSGDSLFSAEDVENLVISGYGAVLRMHKMDYQDKKQYEPAEWRMALSMRGCKNVIIEGVRFESSGGDGIYIGATDKRDHCEDVVIRDVVCYDNHRQGISIISAVNLTIENCSFINTSGTAPQAGIDFEPNRDNEQFKNILMKNCYIEGNKGAGILMYFKTLKKKSLPISIRVENCFIQSGFDHGIAIGAVADEGPGGEVIFKNCHIEGPQKGGIFIFDKSSEGVKIVFDHCSCGNTPQKCDSFPIKIYQMKKSSVSTIGGVSFNDCLIYDNCERSPIVVRAADKKCEVQNLVGTILISGNSLLTIKNETDRPIEQLSIQKVKD